MQTISCEKKECDYNNADGKCCHPQPVFKTHGCDVCWRGFVYCSSISLIQGSKDKEHYQIK